MAVNLSSKVPDNGYLNADLNPGRSDLQPTGGLQIDDAVLEAENDAFDAGHNVKVAAHQYREQLADDIAELDQDAKRLARNVFGANVKLPQAAPIALSKSATQGIDQSLARAIPKQPIADGRMSHFSGHQGKPPVQKRSRVLFGGEPEQKILFRPAGSLQGAVTVS